MYRLAWFISCIGYDAVLDAEGLRGAPGEFPELVARAPEAPNVCIFARRVTSSYAMRTYTMSCGERGEARIRWRGCHADWETISSPS